MNFSRERKLLKEELVWVKENLNQEDCFMCNLALQGYKTRAYMFITANRPSVEKNIFPEYTKSEYWFDGHSWWRPSHTEEVLEIKRQFLDDLINKVDTLKHKLYATTRIYH